MNTKLFLASALLCATAFSAEAQTAGNDTIDYNLSLKEVVVKSAAPMTKMRGGAMVTRIQGTALESAGTADDMLARVPGMMRMGTSLQVIGKGQPAFYINGRRVQDMEELKRLKSHDIREVEVISNPGAAYDATVSAVVRIRTRRVQGDGLSGKMEMGDKQALTLDNNNLTASADLNWHNGSVDIFGGMNFQNDYLDNYHSDLEQYTYGNSTHAQKGYFEATERVSRLHASAGAVWQIDERSSAGVKVERGRWLHNHFTSTMEEDIMRNGQPEDHLVSTSHYDNKQPNTLLANAYYNGRLADWGIELNADFYTSKNEKHNTVDETGQKFDTSLRSLTENTSRLFATRLVIDHGLWQGTMKFGGEVNLLSRDNSYTVEGIETIPNSSSEVSEQNYAAFAEYSRLFPKLGMLTFGLRYEHVSFRFDDLHEPSRSLSRSSDELFPSVSFATQLGLVQLSLGYGIKTIRPSYHALRSETEYVSRYTMQTGNPKLKNEVSHNLDFAARWRWLALAVNYVHTRDAIYDWSYPYDDDGRVMIGMVNFDRPIDCLGTFVVVSPAFGRFTTANTLGMQKQWLTFNLSDPRTPSGWREVSYNKPMLIFNSNNSLRLSHGWQLELNSEFYNKSHFRNARIYENFWNLTAAVQKTFLKSDALVVRLSCSDIFDTAHHSVGLDLGNYYLYETNVCGGQRTLYTFRHLNLTVRYAFNSTKSKYKGKGAGQDIIKRI